MISEKEKKNLEQLLALAENQDCDDLSLTELLGFFYGVAITPEVIVPSEWLMAIFGEEMPEFASEKQAKTSLDTLFRVYNRYSEAFHNGKLAFPYNMADPEGWDLEEAEEWAYGFHKALMLRPECWVQEEIPLLADEEEGEAGGCGKAAGDRGASQSGVPSGPARSGYGLLPELYDASETQRGTLAAREPVAQHPDHLLGVFLEFGVRCAAGDSVRNVSGVFKDQRAGRRFFPLHAGTGIRCAGRCGDGDL